MLETESGGYNSSIDFWWIQQNCCSYVPLHHHTFFFFLFLLSPSEFILNQERRKKKHTQIDKEAHALYINKSIKTFSKGRKYSLLFFFVSLFRSFFFSSIFFQPKVFGERKKGQEEKRKNSLYCNFRYTQINVKRKVFHDWDINIDFIYYFWK